MCAQHNNTARSNILCGRSRMSFLGLTMNILFCALPQRRPPSPATYTGDGCFDLAPCARNSHDVFFFCAMSKQWRRWAPLPRF